MLSRQIVVRTGESPHLIFDKETKEYLDFADGVSIGAHVWIGERAYLTKRAAVSSGSIVAACTVVTKRFDEENVVIAGNPGRIARRGIQWFRNYSFLPEGSEFREQWVSAKDAREIGAANNK